MQKVIAIVGPTASGKTALGIALAKEFGGEVISADSRQIYRGMDLIAGVPGKKEMAGVPHHMLQVADPRRQFSAGTFVKKSEQVLGEIERRKRLPIVVGGTGFYIDALLSDFALPEVAPDKTLRTELQKKTAPQLFAQLHRLDLARAKTIDPHNKVRLIRAIEIAKALGKVPKLTRAPRWDVLWIGLPIPPRHDAKIKARLRARLAKGMRAETKKLRAVLSKKRFLSLGAEFSLLDKYLDGTLSQRELIEKIAQWEALYAKRQMRWLRRNERIHWIARKQEALKLASSFLQDA